jgi:CRISPR-associated protein Csb1
MAEVYSGDVKQLLTDDCVVAVVAQQRLRPVEGHGMPFFPPTYLGSNDKPTYCISPLPDGGNLCTVDSVQSQANRIEEAFTAPPYRALIRKVEVTAALANRETLTLDMLQLGHRLADAAVRLSTLSQEASLAMCAFKQSPDEIARLAPMSLLCGMWDSRGEGSQLKIPRAFGASITARNVAPLRRMATFTGSFWSKDLGLDEKHSAEGIDPVPTGEALGGVTASGDILRSATLNLIALRQNVHMKTGQAPSDAALYILGLGLVALSMQPESFLRQGCLLVADGALDCRVVLRDGREQTLTLDAQAALAFATQAAQRFGIPDLAPICATFEKERLQQAKPAKEKLAKAK